MKQKNLLLSGMVLTAIIFNLSLANELPAYLGKEENNKKTKLSKENNQEKKVDKEYILMEAVSKLIKKQKETDVRIKKLEKSMAKNTAKIQIQENKIKNINETSKKIIEAQKQFNRINNEENRKIAQYIRKQIIDIQNLKNEIQKIKKNQNKLYNSKIERTNTASMIKTTGNLRVRKEPSINSEQIGSLPKNTEVLSTAITKNPKGEIWFEINYKGKAGYIYGKYTKIVINSKDLLDQNNNIQKIISLQKGKTERNTEENALYSGKNADTKVLQNENIPSVPPPPLTQKEE